MNPILLRYAGMALIAAIFGVGGGYLAVNNKKASSPGTESTIQAYPFPGQGGRAIPAVPPILNIPQPLTNEPVPPRGDTPVLSSLSTAKCSYFRTTPEDAYCVQPHHWLPLNTRVGMNAYGNNFAWANNAIQWDGNTIARLFSDDSGAKLYFTTPSDQELCSLHDLSVATINGISNSLKVKIIDPNIGYLWVIPDRDPVTGEIYISGPVGSEIDLRVADTGGDVTEKFYSLDLYAQFSTNQYPPDNSYMSGEAMTPLTVITPPTSENGYEGVYRLKIPSEINRCPTALYPHCGGKLADKMVPLKPAPYGIRVVGLYKGKCSTIVNTQGVDSQPFRVTGE
ncbi:MAG: hypothetical protein AAB469_00735 [Patescibacteria group bacterium]